jgi:xanthine/CO dehydrogenase XdhC/CoxF family maturation factor
VPFSGGRPSGEGIVVASDGGVFLFFAGVHVVEFVIDAAADMMHVERVRRA